MTNPINPINPSPLDPSSRNQPSTNSSAPITAAVAQALGAVAGSFTIPEDTFADPYTGAIPATYNVDIPLNPDGSVNGDALIKKIYDLLYLANKGDTMNYNIYSDMAAYMVNIGKNWTSLPDSLKSQITTMMGQPITSANGSVTMPQLLADSLVYGIYFTEAAQGIPNSQIMQDVQNVINDFAPAAGANPWFQQFANELQNDYNDLPTYMAANPVTTGPNGNATSAQTQFFFQNALVNANLAYSSQASQWFNQYHSSEMDQLTIESHGDPFVLFMLIMGVLFNENDDYQVQIGGFGGLIGNLSSLGSANSRNLSLFQQGGIPSIKPPATTPSPGSFTAASAVELINNLTDFGNRFKDPRLSSVATQIQQPLIDFFGEGTPNTGSVSLTTPVTINGKTYSTLGQLIQGLQTPNSGVVPQNLADALNGMMPSVTPSTGTPGTGINGSTTDNVPQQYTTLSQDLQQMGTTVTSISNTTTTQSQYTSSTAQQQGALVSAALNNIVQVQSQAMRNISTP